MTISSIYIIDLQGKVIISRDYRGDMPRSIVDAITTHLKTQPEERDDPTCKPVVSTTDGNSFMYIQHNDMFVVAATKGNANAMLVMSFLYKLVTVFEDYFAELREESIRDNFVITYELLDEMMDFGYPQSTDSKALQECVQVQERHRLERKAAPDLSMITGQGPQQWRQPGIVHKKNEVFMDVIEKLSVVMSADGRVVNSEVNGVIKVNCFLSGMPELKLGLNDAVLMKQRNQEGVAMEDATFHQCVNMTRFEHDRTISFIPPDGAFDLMKYRLTTSTKPLIIITPRVERHSRTRVSYTIKAASMYKQRSVANNVVITVPVPHDADSPKFKTNQGKVVYVAEKNCLEWTIKTFPGNREFVMHGDVGRPTIEGEDELANKAPIDVKFELPYFTVSGLQVRYLKIIERSGYAALPWVRYITASGDYQVRMA